MREIIFQQEDAKGSWEFYLQQNALKLLIDAEEISKDIMATRVLDMTLFKEHFKEQNIDLYTFEVIINYKNKELKLQKIECLNKLELEFNNKVEYTSRLLIEGTRLDEFTSDDYKINHSGWNSLFNSDEYLAYEGKKAFTSCFEGLEQDYLYPFNIVPRKFEKEYIVAPDDLPF